MINGTSLTKNYRTTEIDELFGTTSVKLPFAGAIYREIDENIRPALQQKDLITSGTGVSSIFTAWTEIIQ